jgi:hypothetical protein
MTTITANNNKKRRRLSIRCIVVVTLLCCMGMLSFSIMHILPEPQSQPVTIPRRTKRQIGACKRMKSVQDIQECYPPQLVRPLNCSHVDDWEDMQRCLTGRFYPEEDESGLEPYTIHIVGERHSGTKFVQRELQQCFTQPSAAQHVKKVHRDFLRVKHFFQPIRHGNYRRSIVIVVVRDPLEWVAAMHEMPYHSPDHVKSIIADDPNNNLVGEQRRDVEPLPWQEFVSRPWTTHRSQLDAQLKKQQNKHPEQETMCQENFAFNEVIPCQMDNVSYAIPPERLRGMSPLYELRRDGSGKPYDHLLELRSDKIVNFALQLPMLFSLGGFLVVRYEDLLQKGSNNMLKTVAGIVGMNDLPDECHSSKPQPERLRQRYIPTGLQDWVEEHLDKDREKLLGYR